VNHPDPESLGMTLVTYDEFFAAIGPRNIITSAEGSSKGQYGMWSSFKTVDRVEVGRIYTSKTYPQTKHYMLRKEDAP
jgi:hypothetical protein